MFVKKLSDLAVIPSKKRNTDAGYDLTSVEDYLLAPGERKAFKTDICLAIPIHLYGRVAPRSGLARDNGIDVLAGVVDASYRGEILVILINHGEHAYQVRTGDRIAQIIFEHYSNHQFDVVADLDSTDRGNNGFGSSNLTASHSGGFRMTGLMDLYQTKPPVEINETRYTTTVKEKENNI